MENISQNFFSPLTKKERRALKKEEQKKDQTEKMKKHRNVKFILWGMVILFFILGGYGIFRIATTPLPGEAVPDLGREHVSPGTPTTYNSNPPTSGPHYPDWQRPGILSEPVEDGYLVHSLEHGYVIVSYNCDIPQKGGTGSAFRFVLPVLAHEDEGDKDNDENEIFPESDTGLEETLSRWKTDPECQGLLKSLEKISEEVGLRKLIITPRPNLDTRIALTAWTRVDKFHVFDGKRIGYFIKKMRNRGPEQTME